LKELLSEIYFLTKNGGHIYYFKDCKEKGGIPDHDMKYLSYDRFSRDLNPFINRKSTLPLKHIIIHANDKIRLLNSYRVNKDKWNEKDIIGVLRELEGYLKNIRKLINKDFNVKISIDEKAEIDEAIEN